eukprot:6484446-Prymnesium_polylepis.1
MLVARSCVVFWVCVRTVRVRIIDVYAASRARASSQITDFTVTLNPRAASTVVPVWTGSRIATHLGWSVAHYAKTWAA